MNNEPAIADDDVEADPEFGTSVYERDTTCAPDSAPARGPIGAWAMYVAGDDDESHGEALIMGNESQILGALAAADAAVTPRPDGSGAIYIHVPLASGAELTFRFVDYVQTP